jgi:transposase
MASSGSLEADSSCFADASPPGKPDRLVAGCGRFILRSCRARRKKTGPNPTDRGKSGSKHHLASDGNGIPLATTLTGANAHDVTQLMPLVDAIPALAGKAGKPRRRPRRVQGDRAYDSEPHRQKLRNLGMTPVLARRNTEHGSGLGIYRWVIERSISWLHQFRRLRVRYERRDDIHEAFLLLGCIVICGYFL